MVNKNAKFHCLICGHKWVSDPGHVQCPIWKEEVAEAAKLIYEEFISMPIEEQAKQLGLPQHEHIKWENYND